MLTRVSNDRGDGLIQIFWSWEECQEMLLMYYYIGAILTMIIILLKVIALNSELWWAKWILNETLYLVDCLLEPLDVQWGGCEFFCCEDPLKFWKLKLAQLDVFFRQLKGLSLFSALADIMGLVNYNNWSLKLHLKVLSCLYIQKVVVGHENNVSLSRTLVLHVIWTKILFLSHILQVLNVDRLKDPERI